MYVFRSGNNGCLNTFPGRECRNATGDMTVLVTNHPQVTKSSELQNRTYWFENIPIKMFCHCINPGSGN